MAYNPKKIDGSIREPDGSFDPSWSDVSAIYNGACMKCRDCSQLGAREAEDWLTVQNARLDP